LGRVGGVGVGCGLTARAGDFVTVVQGTSNPFPVPDVSVVSSLDSQSSFPEEVLVILRTMGPLRTGCSCVLGDSADSLSAAANSFAASARNISLSSALSLLRVLASRGSEGGSEDGPAEAGTKVVVVGSKPLSQISSTLSRAVAEDRSV
jgi:hypothetical protein